MQSLDIWFTLLRNTVVPDFVAYHAYNTQIGGKESGDS